MTEDCEATNPLLTYSGSRFVVKKKTRTFFARLQVAKSVDAVLEETTVLLKRALLENDEFLGQISKVSISGRRKELYPAWRKLLKGGERGEMR